jgi:repressor LexA
MKHLVALEKKGYLRRQEGSSRGISLCNQAQAASLPILGQVRAGALHPAIEDIEGHFAIDQSQLRGGGTFFLRVKGDSMIHAHIKEGDLALVRPQPHAANRDIVVAMVEGEATLKRFYREGDQIRLQPENPNYSPIIIREGDGELSIVGKVVGIYRQME